MIKQELRWERLRYNEPPGRGWYLTVMDDGESWDLLWWDGSDFRDGSRGEINKYAVWWAEFIIPYEIAEEVALETMDGVLEYDKAVKWETEV